MLEMAPNPKRLPFAVDKHQWHPSVLPGQIVLVSTVGPEGQANIAPKSWVTMVAFEGSIVAFGCNVTHTTYQNIRRSGAFVINVPDASLVERIWELPGYRGDDRIRHGGFTLAPSQRVDAPIVTDCPAHLECVYDSEKRYGDEVMIFGRIVAASIDADCLEGDPSQQYFRLRPVFFLEKDICGTLDAAHRLEALPPMDLLLFVVEVGDPSIARETAAVLKQHLSFLGQLRRTGRLLMAGAFASDAQRGGATTAGPRSSGGDMYVVSASSLEDAAAVAKQDPIVLAGAPFVVKAWRRSF
jgi:flavin reductase (DIM6/NTAB) family NADH-FMN oxidoreductase RutF/uncharacterized protein YciI